jgi:thioredoxin-related protein
MAEERPMNRFAVLSSTLLAALLLTACGRDAAAPATGAAHGSAEEAGHAGDIAWFGGSVDEAFAYAKANDKPIFLYWGAAWCPPCNEIKATVFKSREFIDRSRLFVPVYLDGDTDNAQALGEKFGVVGYPTMLVFSPAGDEITRIPGGIDVQAYANVLDLTLARMQPVSALLVRVVEQGGKLSAGECQLTAYYSWEQNEKLLADRDKKAVFGALADACPEESAVERSMLRMSALDAAVAQAADKEAPVPLTDAEKTAARSLVNSVLDDARLVRANLLAVLISGAKTTAAITDQGSEERIALQAKFLAVIDRLAKDESLSRTERLYATIGKIRFEKIDDPEQQISAGLKDEIKDIVERADAETKDVYERQTVINAAAGVLDEAGMKDRAKALLLAEIDKSQQPYYFMVGLAGMEQEDGHNDAALDWLKRAYDAATGPATRFQWGGYYVNGLLEMAPDDVQRIQSETVNVVRELEASKAFYQRPKAQLQRLEKKLVAWGDTPERKEGLAYIRKNVQAICQKIPEQEPARATCDGFLATA